MKYFVLILTFLGFLWSFMFVTSTAYSQTDSFDEMNYSQFLDFCNRYDPALWDSMPIEERLVRHLCDFNSMGFGEKQWNWLNGAKLDWESFTKNASENYADKIPEFTDGGIKETLRVDSFVSGRDSFPPPMMAMISFDYEKLSQVIHYDEKFTICIDGKLVPQDSFIECSDEYVRYDFTKEEPFSVPKFAKKIPLPEHTRQQMSEWCQNSPKWAKIDKQFWDVIPIRLVSNTDEFQSLQGIKDSFVINSNAGHDTCPPTVWASGTFASEDGKRHRFALEYNADFFRYNIDEIHCKDGLTVVTKSSDGSSACVKPETKRILIERGWAAKDDEISETKSWNTVSGWNSLNLLRNNDGLYCKSANNKLTDPCYSLEEIVFGNHHKKGEQGWKIYPGGAGWRLPENSTLTPIYKEVKFGMMPLDFTAMLDDTTFVNKCESNGGTWNYTYHNCEGLSQICDDEGGVYVRETATIQIGCVFPYEN